MATERPASVMLQLIFLTVSSFLTVSNTEDVYDNTVFQAGNGNTFSFGEARPTRFLLYDVNPGEGFNLRRDVYMRIANLVQFLNKDEPWTLVLPPWGHLYHWKSRGNQFKIKWSTFFDIQSLSRHVPVIEFDEYLKVRRDPIVDEIYYLQRYKEGWTSGEWQEKMDERECIDRTGFEKTDKGEWKSWFWGYEHVRGLRFKCMSVQAEAVYLKSFLQKNTTGMCVFLVRAEQLIHGQYSEWSRLWWTARRSMVFAKNLRQIGDEFRESELMSTDVSDNTVWDEDWTQMERKHGEAVGGPYLAVHLRRQDFLYGHSDDMPTIKGAAAQIKQILTSYNLTTVFIATDAPRSEYAELKGYLEGVQVTRYVPTPEVMESYMDGGIAIIDQWIAAHARVFYGTAVSTFSFRIHEEREIMGFRQETTFNCLCPDKQRDCEQPTKWTIKY